MLLRGSALPCDSTRHVPTERALPQSTSQTIASSTRIWTDLARSAEAAVSLPVQGFAPPLCSCCSTMFNPAPRQLRLVAIRECGVGAYPMHLSGLEVSLQGTAVCSRLRSARGTAHRLVLSR